MNDVTIGQYIPVESSIHRLDPRTKILATFVWIVILIATRSLAGFSLDACALLVIVLLSHVPLKTVVKSTKVILPIIIFTSFFNLIYTQGEVIWSFWIFHVTSEGIEIALTLTLRILLIVMGASILTFTTSLTDITNGIESLLSPLEKLGVRVSDFSMMVALAIRFIPTLSEEIKKIKDAQKARGAQFNGKKMTQKIREVMPIIIPLIYSSFRRAHDLTNAIECRCYNQEIKRTKLNPLKYGSNDVIGGLCIVLFIVLLIIIENNQVML